jgi:hypothetical protein
MSGLTPARHRSLGRAAFVFAAVVVAALLSAWTLASGRATGVIDLWSDLVVASPEPLLEVGAVL